jgi:transcriptional regulator with XRE-family HTH domain
MTVAERLKVEREKHGLTQQQVADALKMARGAYAHYETGKNMPPIDNLLKLADLYKVSLDYLTGRYS